MTRITLTSPDHHGDIVKTGEGRRVRFPAAEGHECSVPHEDAVTLVESYDDVEFASGVPRMRADLRELGAALPTDELNGNSPSDEIVEFLEQFEDDELDVLKANPGALTERRSGDETVYAVELADDSTDEEAE